MRTHSPGLSLWALCLLAICWPFADCPAAEWLNQEMTLKLTAVGGGLTGTFTRTRDGVQGTVTGTPLEDGLSVKLTFRWDDAEGGGECWAMLTPTAKGRLLSGVQWDASGVPTAVGFHRADALQAADLPDEDTDFGTGDLTPPDEGTTTKPVTQPPTGTTSVPTGDPVTIFDTMNTARVSNQPKTPTTFATSREVFLTSVMTYHWNDGRGASGGTISIRSEDGTTYGPWATTTLDGSGARNVAWVAEPNVALPAGAYTVLDSEPATWSQNAESGGAGMTTIKGIPLGDATTTPTTPPGAPVGLPKLKLILCTTMQGDRPADPATRFRKPKQLHCWTEYENMPEDTAVTCIWVRDGRSLSTNHSTIGKSGWVQFGISTTSPDGFPPGKYTVKLRAGDTVIGYQEFTVE